MLCIEHIPCQNFDYHFDHLPYIHFFIVLLEHLPAADTVLDPRDKQWTKQEKSLPSGGLDSTWKKRDKKQDK